MASRKITGAHIILKNQYENAKEAFEKENPTAKVFLIATYRSNEEQTTLYEQGRTKQGIR